MGFTPDEFATLRCWEEAPLVVKDGGLPWYESVKNHSKIKSKKIRKIH